MIDLSIERDSKGRYCLNEKIIEGLSPRWADNSYKRVFWITDKDGEKYVLKYTGKKERSLSLLGELIFSKFAQKNNIPSANIDVAYDYDSNELVVVSQNVCSSGEYDESFDLGELVHRFTIFDINEMDDDYSVKKISSVLRMVGRDLGISVQSGLSQRLKELCLIDYLVGQEDRNATNILVDIRHTGSDIELRLCPIFDNEYAFCFGALSGYGNAYEYVQHNGSKNPVKVSTDSINETCVPLLGIKKSPTTLDSLIKELKEELSLNEKLLKFYNRLNFDFKEIAKEIKSETGFVISEEVIKYCENFVQQRKALLDKALMLQTEENGKGE